MLHAVWCRLRNASVAAICRRGSLSSAFRNGLGVICRYGGPECSVGCRPRLCHWCTVNDETVMHESCEFGQDSFLGNRESLSRMHDQTGIYTPQSRLIDTRYLSGQMSEAKDVLHEGTAFAHRDIQDDIRHSALLACCLKNTCAHPRRRCLFTRQPRLITTCNISVICPVRVPWKSRGSARAAHSHQRFNSQATCEPSRQTRDEIRHQESILASMALSL